MVCMQRFLCPDNKESETSKKKSKKSSNTCGCISTATNKLEPISEPPLDRERLPVEKRDMGQNVWIDRAFLACCLTCASTACMQFVSIFSHSSLASFV